MIGTLVHMAGEVTAQGEKTVGASTVQLVAARTPCSRVWIGAPSSRHTKGAANTSPILVGSTNLAGGGNAAGGIFLDTTNTTGFFYPCDDASKVFLTGFTAGDAVEYQIFR